MALTLVTAHTDDQVASDPMVTGALEAAREWDDGHGLLSSFGDNPVVSSEAHRRKLFIEIDACMAEATERAVGMEEVHIWYADCRRLRRLRMLVADAPHGHPPEVDEAPAPAFGR